MSTIFWHIRIIIVHCYALRYLEHMEQCLKTFSYEDDVHYFSWIIIIRDCYAFLRGVLGSVFLIEEQTFALHRIRFFRKAQAARLHLSGGDSQFSRPQRYKYRTGLAAKYTNIWTSVTNACYLAKYILFDLFNFSLELLVVLRKGTLARR